VRHLVTKELVPRAIRGLESAERYAALHLISPCQSTEKNQDRLATARNGATLFATVCDGATQSLMSEAAAEVLTDDPVALWNDGVLTERIRLLERRRDELVSKAAGEVVDQTSFLSRSMADIVRKKRRQAYQSTFVSVRVTVRPSSVFLEARLCGDSALLVFDELGRLLYSNLRVHDAASSFNHISPYTDVLPDHYQGEALSCALEIGADSHVVLCSDGFYDAFPNAGALFRWLLLNGARMAAAGDELHKGLQGSRGDDDISAVWLYRCTQEIASRDTAALAPQALKPSTVAARCWQQVRRLFRVGGLFAGGQS